MKKYFSYFLAFTVLSSAFFGLFSVSNASATGDYADFVQTTDVLPVKMTSSDAGIDLTTTWYSSIMDNASCSSKSLLETAIAESRLSVTLYERNPGGDISGYTDVHTAAIIHFSEASGGGTTSFYEDSFGWAGVWNNYTGTNYQIVIIQRESNPGVLQYLCTSGSYSFISTSPTYGTAMPWKVKTLLSTYPVTYPSGYAGAEVPDTISSKPTLNPPFSYNVTDKVVTARYTGPSCIEDPDNEGVCVPFKLLWNTNNGDGIVNEGDDTKYLEYGQEYTFTYPENGTYGLFLTYVEKGVPYAPLPEYYEYTVSQAAFEIDGTSFQGNLDTCTVSDGYCIVNTIVYCDDITNWFEQTACKVSNTFDTGLINPSLNAFKSLFTAMVVPSTPTCGFTLATANIGGQTFDPSSLGTTVCTRMGQIHDGFPILSILVNFSLAIAVLYLVVGIFNKLTKPDDHDLIVGVK